MKIAIVGWGLEAQSAFKFFGPEHEYLIVNESAQDDFPAESDKVKLQFLAGEKPVGISGQVGDLCYLNGIDAYDKIVYQPTAYFNLQKVYGDKPDFWAKATTVYDIFFENTPSKNIIGITGTKGKGTTSALTAKLLEAQGVKTHLGGNIGTPILELLPDIKPGDWIVWELANFQLKPASYSPHIGVCLMITQEHLDWHPSFEDYLDAKANLFKHQTTDDIAIYYAKNEYSKQIAEHSPGKKIPYYEAPGAFVRDDGTIVLGETEVINKSDVKLLGAHNLQNICAALTAVFAVAGSLDNAKTVLSSFSGLEHRLELVREFQGVKYYDDSFATTPSATIVALQAFAQPKIVVLGGSDKGATFEELAQVVKDSNVRQALVIGKIGDKISVALEAAGFNNITTGLTSMPQIIQKARELAQPGDVVLLSTAAASFDMFKDYKDRGNQFKKAVLELA